MVEVSALEKAFAKSSKTQFCGLGSVKSSIGHCDTAAGAASLLKTVLALEHKTIPATLHFSTLNPKLKLDTTPFYIASKSAPWPENVDHPRRAGVSSFGMGGSNAHVIVEEYQNSFYSESSHSWHILPFSAKNDTSLEQFVSKMSSYFSHTTESLSDIAYTLQAGRQHFQQRQVLVINGTQEAAQVLSAELETEGFLSKSKVSEKNGYKTNYYSLCSKILR